MPDAHYRDAPERALDLVDRNDIKNIVNRISTSQRNLVFCELFVLQLGRKACTDGRSAHVSEAFFRL